MIQCRKQSLREAASRGTGGQYNGDLADDLVFAADAEQPLPIAWRLGGTRTGAAWSPPPLARRGRGSRRAALMSRLGRATPVPLVFRASMVALTESVTGTGPCSLANVYSSAQGGPCGTASGPNAVPGFELAGKIGNTPIVGIAPLYNGLYGPNSNWPGPDSNHSGVVLVVFADGHTSTIVDGIDFSVWASLHTRNGGEPLDGNF